MVGVNNLAKVGNLAKRYFYLFRTSLKLNLLKMCLNQLELDGSR